jgi:hypothetical protein
MQFLFNFKNCLKRFPPAISQARQRLRKLAKVPKIPQERCSSIFHDCFKLVESGRLLVADLNHGKGLEKVLEGFEISGETNLIFANCLTIYMSCSFETGKSCRQMLEGNFIVGKR